MILRRTITRLPIPERVIRVINDWEKLLKTEGFKNNLELWDCMKDKYYWDNKDLYVSDGKVEVEPVNAYPHIPAEISGVPIEYDSQPDEGGVQENRIPTMSYLAAADRANSGLALTPGVSQTTGVELTHNVLDLTDVDDDYDEDLISEVIHKVENVPEN